MGLGAVGVGVGAVFGATAQSTLDEIRPERHRNTAFGCGRKIERTDGNVGFGVGAAAGITGLLWYLLGSSAEDSHAAVLSFDDGLGMAFGGRSNAYSSRSHCLSSLLCSRFSERNR